MLLLSWLSPPTALWLGDDGGGNSSRRRTSCSLKRRRGMLVVGRGRQESQGDAAKPGNQQ